MRASNLNSQQTQLQGTDWVTSAEVVTNCSNSDCHCLTDIGVTNNSVSTYTVKYLECGVTGTTNMTSLPLPAGGSSTITDCVNVNSLVLSRTNQAALGDVPYDFGSAGGCDEYTYFSGLELCCDSTDTPITGPVGFLNTLNVSVNDYVVVNGDAYQVTGSTTSSGTQYPSATGGYTSCSDAVSNATNGCRYDFEPCCTSGTNQVSYYPPFSVTGSTTIYTIGDSFFNQAPPPYPGQVDKCMSVQPYSGNYTVNNSDPFLTGMQNNGQGCFNRCSRCTYLVQPCGWPSSAYLLVHLTPQGGMLTGTVWSDTGLASWIATNQPSLPSTNCYTIVGTSAGTAVGIYSNAYNFTQTLQTGGCGSAAC